MIKKYEMIKTKENFLEFKGSLGQYKIVITEDNTQTLFSEYFNEACHNLSGAMNETIYNYIEGCHIFDQLNNDSNIHVLDVGFGLGIGLKAFYEALIKSTNEKSRLMSYTSIELDEELFLWSMRTNFIEINFQKFNTNDLLYYMFKVGDISCTVFIGDGRKTLLQALHLNLLPRFTAIFQDAFSPKRNPVLWTVEWFSDLKSMSDEEVYLSTYSSSVSIRKSLLKSGWVIENAPGFGTKKTMTKARLKGVMSTLLEAELSRSPILELRDI